MKHDWEYKKLGEVVSSINGLWTGKKEPFVTIPVISLKNFTKDCKLKKEEYSIIDVEVRQFASRKLQYGDIIIEKSGGSDTQPVGRPILFDIKEGDYSFSNFTATLRVNDANKESLNSLFLHNVLLAYYKQGKTLSLQSKTTGIHNLDLKSYLRLPIPVPPLPTQQSIVSELDSLSKIIADCKETLKDYDALEQSIFYDMFGDPVKNDKGWEVREMGSICEVTSFKRVLIEDVVDEGIPFVRGTELTEMCGLTRGDQMKFSLFITQEHYERVKKITGVPSVGDLLIPSINSKGYVWIVDTTEPMYYKDGRVLWVHINKDFFRSEYLQKTINSILLNSYSLMASGATFAELKLFILRELNIPVPPIELQIQFADKINAIEQMKAETKEALQEAETLFQARMDYWFN